MTFSRSPRARWAATASALALIGSIALAPANAGTRSYADVSAHSSKTMSSAVVPTQSRSMVLPYGKSEVVEVSAPLKDVIISNPDIVQAVMHTDRRTVLIGKSPGQTNAYYYGRDGRELMNIDIRVERDMSGLRDLMRKHVDGTEVEIQAVNNNILLTGSVPNAAMSNRIEALARMWLGEVTEGSAGEGEIVNLMSIEGKDQVMLKVRIVEMQRSVTKQLGVNLSAVAELGDSTVRLFSNNSINPGAGFDGSLDWLNSGGGDIRSISGALQALERVGLIRTLAEPTLTAISGETANFLSGGEFPLLTGISFDDFGRLVREFEFKPYGVSLGFTPVVLSEGRISLNISTEVSEPTTEGSFETGGVSSDILGLRVRRAETVVEMPAGGSLVIAGLIREESRQASEGTPGLKDIPGIGAAFRNRDDINTQSELVVIVTPYLVDPTHPDKLQTPLDGFIPVTDRDSLYLGRMNEVYANAGAGPLAAETLPGPFGHVVD